MKKIAFGLMILLTLGACLPFDIPGSPTGTPITQDLPTQTDVAPTPTALLPSPTTVLVSVTDTPLPPSAPINTDAVVLAPSVTSPPNLTTTPATSTDLPANSAFTSTPTLVSGAPTLTPTLGILTYGTLPPSVPFNTITIWNKSKAQAYISLQVTLPDGRFSILEYPVEKMINVKAPLGSYVYVAWVGGNKMVGSFRLSSADSLTIILFKDKVVIQ
jgi:hypothetical protein